MRLSSLLVAAGLLLLAACSVTPPEEEKAQTEKIVVEYIEAHPETIIESIRRYQDKMRADQIKAEEEQRFSHRVQVKSDGAPSEGPADAPITLVEFSDMQCPYCARALPVIAAVKEAYAGKIRHVFKHYPLPFHAGAIPAAQAAVAAGEQGKFWEYKRALMQRQAEWGQGDADKVFFDIAKGLGLDLSRWDKDRKKPDIEKRVTADLEEGRTAGVQGTPTFVINGVVMSGAQPVEQFQKTIDRLLSEGTDKPSAS